ncbi:MAG: hypothetical protein HY042_05610 [Spirochaetia bacterium]|nr:hypothetical protein [Spirochaetia bacterium]
MGNNKKENPRSQNPFLIARQKRGVSLRALARETELDRKVLKALDDGNISDVRIGDVIRAAQRLDVDMFDLLINHFNVFPAQHYSEYMDDLVSRVAWLQFSMVTSELERFAKGTGTRLDDFNLSDVVQDKSNLHKLVALNRRLEKKSVTPRDALRQFPPTRPFNRRRSGER